LENAPTTATGKLPADYGTAAQQLLALDEHALAAAMSRLAPAEAARLIQAAPALKDKSRLLWAMDRHKRADVLDQLPVRLVAALVQNLEDQNKLLLGNISIDTFRRVLAACAPAQKYYWLALANSFLDDAANLLTLSVPARELAEMLMTVPEFRQNLNRLAEIEPAGLTIPLPIRDPKLRRILQTVIDLEEEAWGELMKAALEIQTYRRDHPEEQELTSEPIVLREFETIPLPKLRRPVPTAPEDAFQPTGVAVARTASLPVRVSLGAAVAALSEADQERVNREFLELVQDEVDGLGGSYAEADLRRAIGRARFYVQVGLGHLSGDDPEEAAKRLAETPAREVARAGMAVLEGIRQVAVRLRAFRRLLDARQMALLSALCRPDPDVRSEAGDMPVLHIQAAGGAAPSTTIPLADVPDALSDVADWVALARRLESRELRAALRAKTGGADAVAASLVVALAIYGRWEVGLVELPDVEEFRRRHYDAEAGRLRPGLREMLITRTRQWAGQDAERVEYVLMAAAGRLERLLAEVKELTTKLARGRVWLSDARRRKQRKALS